MAKESFILAKVKLTGIQKDSKFIVASLDTGNDFIINDSVAYIQVMNPYDNSFQKKITAKLETLYDSGGESSNLISFTSVKRNGVARIDTVKLNSENFILAIGNGVDKDSGTTLIYSKGINANQRDFNTYEVASTIQQIFTALDVSSSGGIQSIVAGTNITVDDTDPENPIVSSTSGGVLSASRTLSSAEILSLNSTPIEIIPAQGAGITIVPLAIFISSDSGTAYSTDVTARFLLNNSTWQQASVFGANDTSQARLSPSSISTSPANSWENGSFDVTTPTANPTGGTMEVKITVLYHLVSL